MKHLLHFALLGIFLQLQLSITAQPHVNGELDAIEDFTTKVTIPITMPDGTNLMTDVSVPVMSDSVMVTFDLLGEEVTLQLIPQGTQVIIYDSLYSDVNPNPYQLPLIFTRIPYGKNGDATGSIIPLLGYAYAIQDMRGRYESEGVYFPMLSDSWDKTPYHPDFDHIADITELSNPINSNKHEDGYHSIDGLLNLTRQYDIDSDGIIETFNLCNGSIGMFGASAMGNTQLQMAAAHRINPALPGLKSLTPIVATLEHHSHTGYNNGVFREQIVQGWVMGQIMDIDEDAAATDTDLSNNIHSPADYNLNTNQEVGDLCIDHFSAQRYNGGVASAYPNAKVRAEMDASHAPVNEFGEGDASGTYSRYGNLDVPIMHFTGWWDIFISGQIETLNRTLANLQSDFGNEQLQKMIIGPYAHQTVGSRTTGDITYKENAVDYIGLDISTLDLEDLSSAPVDEILQSEAIAWYRYTLNERQGLGEPKIIIPESEIWQDLGGFRSARIPSQDFVIGVEDLINFVGGVGSLPPIRVELQTIFGISTIDIPVPAALVNNLGISLAEPIESLASLDYTTVPNFRFYVVGPVNDGISDNTDVGNYWIGSNHFPLTDADGVQNVSLFLHGDNTLSYDMPSTPSSLTYEHNPDDPILTVGGANMIVKTPTDNRDSQGQMNLADPNYAPFTLEREGILSFTSPVIEDSISVVGFPTATIYASSTPTGETSGPTDTDFFVRVLDVYPDGSEYFVVEGAVNARARDYARSIADGVPNDDIAYTNIDIGEIYEYKFDLLPIAYTWGKDHQIKVLISSSNWTRYQVNPNLPIEDGDFFRRQPNDGQTYTYNGQEMSPRIADQEIFFSPNLPSHISFPFYCDGVDCSFANKKLYVKMLLEGAYSASSGLMSTQLRSNNLLPINQPFNTTPWNYNGSEAFATNASLPTNAVDWVLIELRSANDINTIVAQKAAVLLSNGAVSDIDGSEGISFNTVTDGDYFIVLRGRNHLDVVSSMPITFPNNSMSATDFSSSSNVAEANSQMIEVSSGVFALSAGDFNNNGVISVTDYNLYINNTAATNQYIVGDANADGNITVDDFNLYQFNASKIGLIAVRY